MTGALTNTAAISDGVSCGPIVTGRGRQSLTSPEARSASSTMDYEKGVSPQATPEIPVRL
jgi:hypothetical protein